MEVYREEIFGPVLSVVRVQTRRRGDRADQREPLRQRHGDLHLQRRCRAQFQRGVKVGMIGINVPIPVPMAYYSFGGWKDSLFGDTATCTAPKACAFYTRAKVVTSRWPAVSAVCDASYHFPTSTWIRSPELGSRGRPRLRDRLRTGAPPPAPCCRRRRNEPPRSTG